MIACLDVRYEPHGARAACVLFRASGDAIAATEKVAQVDHVEPYQPGRFYRRELPRRLAVLAEVSAAVQTAVIDGYVWLGDEKSPGLGAHLYDARSRRTAVIGVPKTWYARRQDAGEVVRGTSRRPLFVTAAGVGLGTACCSVQAMHGPFQVPTLLKRAGEQAASTFRLHDERTNQLRLGVRRNVGHVIGGPGRAAY